MSRILQITNFGFNQFQKFNNKWQWGQLQIQIISRACNNPIPQKIFIKDYLKIILINIWSIFQIISQTCNNSILQKYLSKIFENNVNSYLINFFRLLAKPAIIRSFKKCCEQIFSIFRLSVNQPRCCPNHNIYQ